AALDDPHDVARQASLDDIVGSIDVDLDRDVLEVDARQGLLLVDLRLVVGVGRAAAGEEKFVELVGRRDLRRRRRVETLYGLEVAERTRRPTAPAAGRRGWCRRLLAAACGLWRQRHGADGRDGMPQLDRAAPSRGDRAERRVLRTAADVDDDLPGHVAIL